jgi:Protein of unknown function (DUF2029).
LWLQGKIQKQPEIRYHFVTLVLLLLIFCGAAAQSFYPATDPARYQCYALTFWQGSNSINQLPHVQCTFLQITHPQPSFHMLPKEYPPFTLIPFSLPLLLPFINYQIIFALLMSLTILLLYWLLLRFGRRNAAFAYMLYITLGACAIAPMRYDLLPALSTLLCLIAARYQRWTLAYLALAVGVLLKIYPLLLFPALFIAEQQAKACLVTPASTHIRELPNELWQAIRSLFRCSWGNTLLFFATLLVVTGLFALSDIQNALISQFAYFLQRPVQIESLNATLTWIAHKGGRSWKIAYEFGSINIYTSLNSYLSTLFTCLLIFGVIYTLWLQWQQRCSLPQTAIALLLIFIATGKVFSPQYLIWLIPLLAYAGYYTRPWLYIWSAISLLTTFIYVVFYSQILNPKHIVIPVGFFEIAALRNMLLTYLTLAYLFNWHHLRTTNYNSI